MKILIKSLVKFFILLKTVFIICVLSGCAGQERMYNHSTIVKEERAANAAEDNSDWIDY